MDYTSYKDKVLAAMAQCKKEFCEGVGTLVVAEVQPLVPLLTGNLKKSIASDVLPDNTGIEIGVTPNAPYGIYVEKGIGQTAQPYLEPGAMNAIPKIQNVAERVYKQKMGG